MMQQFDFMKVNIKQIFVLMLGLLCVPMIKAQSIPTVSGISRNSVTNLHGEGGRIWVGPELNFSDDGGITWKLAPVDSIQTGRGSLYSVDVEGNVIWAGLGFSQRQKTTDSIEPVALGFVFSEDNGTTWRYRIPPIDAPQDSLITYGISVIHALPVTTPVQSPPYDIDYDSGRGWVWTAGWASGIRYSKDKGATWNRAILPPDSQTDTNPGIPQGFYLTPVPRKGQPGNENHKGFAVLVDETGTVWGGTSGGLNRSADGLAWHKISYNGSPIGIPGNWITVIEEQPLAGRNPVWISCWKALDAKESYGIAVTRDGGQTFEQMLMGEKIYDITFNGTTVYAAGDNGLFISEDQGVTWRSVRDFRDPQQSDRYIRPDARVYSVAVTNSGAELWVGMQDGLLKSLDGGKTWQLYRTEVPLHPAAPTERIPDVTNYAYPNPFSPATDQVVRLRYGLESAQKVSIRIFDFSMSLVRTLVLGESRSAGTREEVWDGRDNGGLKVANGAYFYTISAGTETFRGKILVLE